VEIEASFQKWYEMQSKNILTMPVRNAAAEGSIYIMFALGVREAVESSLMHYYFAITVIRTFT
jgi:hypothetical protein